jgi:hypothetical protein
MEGDVMTEEEEEDIEVLYSRFKEQLDRLFGSFYGSGPPDPPSPGERARARANLQKHPRFDRTRFEELVLRAEREAGAAASNYSRNGGDVSQ